MSETLSLADRAEWLAREPSEEYIKSRDFVWLDFCDVSMRSFPKVRFVCLLRKFIPLGRKDTLTIRTLEGKSHPADPGKKVDKCEIFLNSLWHFSTSAPFKVADITL